MADYREISQQYAQGAIKAVILVNGGAAVAVLSQVSTLLRLFDHQMVGYALLAFLVGISSGLVTWLFGFFSTRHVDIAEQSETPDYRVANLFQGLGSFFLILGIACFLGGGSILAISFASSAPSP